MTDKSSKSSSREINQVKKRKGLNTNSAEANFSIVSRNQYKDADSEIDSR